MNIKPCFLPFLAVLSIFLFSFRNTDKAVPGRIADMATPGSLVKMQTDTGGRTVSLDSAQLCINRFATLMKDHGFSDQAGQNVNIRIKKTSMITTGESFSGKNLQDWLTATTAQYAAAGKTLMINIQLGVYDMNYLNTYQPNAALRSANNNRIAIFLIPYDASTGQAVHALVAQPNGNGGTQGGTGFDLGGVQP